MVEELSRLIQKEKEQDLITFLKQLSPAQKKELVPVIKKLHKEYDEFKPSITGSYRYEGSEAQRTLTLYARFVCFNRVEYEKIFSAVWILEEKHLKKIINWYCPDWFSDFVNKQANGEFMPYYITYTWVMELYKAGYLQPSKDLLAKQLTSVIFENNKREWNYKPGNVLIYPETLQEHIWYLFECETNIHYSDRWLNFGKEVSKEKVGWIVLFKQLTSEGKIERLRVLKESLLASNRNFNKVLSGWYSELFTELQPTDEEIMKLQKEIFSTLSSPQSKPVNTGLNAIKKVVQSKEFDAAGFLDYAPVLLSSSTKNVVASSLMIFEKLGKKRKELQVDICKQATQAFVLHDDDLQTRTAKLIAGFISSLDESFSDSIAPYRESMMSNAKKILEKFFATENDDDAAVEITTTLEPEELIAIESPSTIDDFIFLASQAFDNNQSWHIDLFASELIKWLPRLGNENIERLEPALQRALKITKNDFRAGQGSLDHMLAIFFIDVCVMLVRKYPDESKVLYSMFKKFDQQDGNITRQWMAIAPGASYMKNWSTHGKDPFYFPYKKLLLAAIEKIEKEETLPLLSTPTHEPVWILPELLVERIAFYQDNSVLPHDIDFQIAVSRCHLANTTNAIHLAEKKLKGEYLNMMLFLFGKHKEPVGPFTNEAAWMCCSLSIKEKKQYKQFANFSYYKKPFGIYTGVFPWKSFEEDYTANKYDYANGKLETIYYTDKRKVLKVYIDKSKVIEQESGLRKFLSSLLPQPKPGTDILYEFFTIKEKWLSAENDFRRIIFLAPNNPDPFVIEIVKKCLENPIFWGESDKRMVITSLQALYDIWDHFGEPAHLMVATCLLSADKTVINIAGEIWQKGVTENKINNELIGKIIGLHESFEFAPLKRFTDIATINLFRVSALHNQRLQELIEYILTELPTSPIKNLKKLLELYVELLSVNKTRLVPGRILEKAKEWNKIGGLQKVTNEILK